MGQVKPKVLYTKVNGRHLVRFDDIQDVFWYDIYENNPKGIVISNHSKREYEESYKYYFENRNILNESKKRIIRDARKDMQKDKDFLKLVYKAKTEKRQYTLNKHGGILSMPHYVTNSEKVFKQGHRGAKKATLNMAFQVGTFMGQSYTKSFIKILKTIMMCQHMNISVNIDMFDSDRAGINHENSYVICNVAKSSERLDLKKILTCSHIEFFNCSLFNGYAASGYSGHINTFLSESMIKEDLSERYDVIGGNTLREAGNNDEQREMISRILKIGLK